MNQNAEESPRWYKRWELRLIAVVLAASLLLSISANIFVGIRIQKGDNSQAAENYLVDNTDYLDKNTMQRLGEKLKAMQALEDLGDYYRLAGTQIAEEKYDLALQNIEICIDMYQGENEVLYEDLLMKRGCLLVLLAQYDRAIEALDQVLEAFPTSKDAYLVEAQVYAEQGRDDRLAETLLEYLRYYPDHQDMRLLLAETYFGMGAYEEASVQYETLLSMENADNIPEIAYLSGLTYLQLSDYDSALKRLAQAETDGKPLDGVSYYIGVCRMAQEDYESAEQAMTDAITGETMLQQSYYSRGVCRLMTEQTEAALKDLQFAADYTGEDADETVRENAKQLIGSLKS